MSSRYALLVVFCICLHFSVNAATHVCASDKPLNVLFIAIDDLRPELASYKVDGIQTPHIDRLAAQGLRFNAAYCQYPVCNPSRSSFLTGLRPDDLTILSNRVALRKKWPKLVTLPQLFRQNGYFTAGLGKLFHQGLDENGKQTLFRDDASFDYFFNAKGNEPEIGKKGEGRKLGDGTVNWARWLAAEGGDLAQADGMLATEAVRLLEENHDKPFFIGVGFHKPHDPFIAPKEYFDLYPLGKMKLAKNPSDRTPLLKYALPNAYNFETFTDRDRREFKRAYHACTSFVDAQVGKVLGAMDRLKLWDNTIVVLLGDHGYHLGEHGWWNKVTVFDIGARVPLVMWVPKSGGIGAETEAVVELLDLYPSLADLCNLEPPHELQGESLKPILENPSVNWRKPAFTQVVRGRVGMGYSVRYGDWRLTQWGRDGSGGLELYDVVEDKEGYYNCANDPEYAETLDRLHEFLKKGYPNINRGLSAKPFAKTRLVIMADMGNEPDEEQQMVHMLMYSNMFDLEGLIAVSGKHLHSKHKIQNRQRVYPDLFEKLVISYGKVLPNLKKHADGWPEVDYLRSIIKPGTAEYGTGGIGPGKESPGSKLIVELLQKSDPRPVFIVGNAGTNTLAQALRDLDETKSDAEMDAICRKIIVYENGAQDDSGVWIMLRYPNIKWYRSNRQTYGYGGPKPVGKSLGPYTWEPYARNPDGQNDWAKNHIMTGHGPLGASFPPRIMKDKLHFVEGGGTSPWTGLTNHGLFDPQHMHWGGWGGRFSKKRHSNKDQKNTLIWSHYKDISISEREQAAGKEFKIYLADTEHETWIDPIHKEKFSGFYVPVWRFRRAMFNDFRVRMDWCVKPYKEANHNPVAAVNGDKSDNIIITKVKAGETLEMDASKSTDPDGDELNCHWWVYKEAGTYKGDVGYKPSKKSEIKFKIPADAKEKQIHLILEVSDINKEIPMYDYRRVIFDVAK